MRRSLNSDTEGSGNRVPVNETEIAKDPVHPEPNALTANKNPYYEVGKTTILVGLWISMGLLSSVITPSVDALRERLSCNYEQLARVMVSKNVGIIFGSVALGFLADKFKRKVDLLLSVEALFMTVGIGLVPWCPTLVIMSSAFFVAGFAQGGISATGNSHCMAIWGKKAHVPLHIVHFGYGLGSAVGPFLLIPFIGSTNNTQPAVKNVHWMYTESNPITFTGQNLEDFHTVYSEIENLYSNGTSNGTNPDIIRVPFAIAGGFGVLVALALGMFVFIPWPENLLTARQQPAPSSESSRGNLKFFSVRACFENESTAYGVTMLTLLVVFYVGLVGQSCAMGVYLYAAAVDSSLHFTATQGTYLVVLYFGTYAVGRLAAIFVAIVVRVQVLIFVEIIGILAGMILLCIFGLTSSTALWILAPTVNFFAGPLYPTGMAWADKYVKMTALAVSLLDIAIGLGAFLATWATGYIFQYYSTVYVFYFSTAWTVLCFISVILLQIIGSLHGERTRNELPEVEYRVSIEDANAETTNDSQPLIQ